MPSDSPVVDAAGDVQVDLRLDVDSVGDDRPTAHELAHADRFVRTRSDDPLAEPLLAELEREYDERYGSFFGEPASAEIRRYPVDVFTPARGGAFILLLRGDEVVAGGAYKRFDDQTAELKRIWASSSHRREGLARRVVTELEQDARRSGYSRVYLTTGPRQPEARALYLATAYTPLFDTTLTPDEVVIHGFAKSLDDRRLDVAGIRAAHSAALAGRRAVGSGAAE